ncbi:MAG: hypothetical protein M1829_002497 [Trizodia sp. TS-e1964]|nr:MAG: hypothetical protein M1829_002497 [Trizodia sp. TS-e1964]
MSRRKLPPTLSTLGNYSSEDNDNQNILASPALSVEIEAPAKKTRGRPKAGANKDVKTTAAAKKASASSTAAAKKPLRAKKPATTKRTVLKEQINEHDSQEAVDLGDLDGPAPVQADDSVSEDELDKPVVAPKRRGRPPVKQKLAKQETKELEVEEPKKHGSDEDVEMEEASAHVVQEVLQAEDAEIPEPLAPLQSQRARQPPRTRQPLPLKAAATISDSERTTGDAASRRKLGDMTKKLETLEVRFRNLREVGIQEAEANFQSLKKQIEDQTSASNDLIASLKKELAAQTLIAKESRALQKQLTVRTAELAAAHTTNAELTSSLAEQKNESKILLAKLAANRATSASVQSTDSKVPGSVVKGGGRTLMVGSAEAAQAAQSAQLKEDLYSDLTGLIVRSVKREEDSDVYDCIQTGRNGTLHFKLAVETDNENYEKTAFTYTPRLDSNRDRALIEILPDYLTEEITFSRDSSVKFYSRLIETLTMRLVA